MKFSKLFISTIALFLLANRTMAQDAPLRQGVSLRQEQARLAAHVRSDLQDIDAALRYAAICAQLEDYEAAIGALERLLAFNPAFSRARKELGLIYARIGAYQQSAQHLRAALAEGDLDADQIAQIRGQLPDIEKRATGNRLFVRMAAGLRAQSNANFFPANNLFQVGGVGVASAQRRVGDVNSFQLVQASHEYDFDTQNGDLLETRVTAYATEQFKLPQYSVALFSASTGPRFFAPQSAMGRLSVRPYVTGLVSMLGSSNYLNAGGAGVSFSAEVADLVVEPGFEWRSIWVDPVNFQFGRSPDSTLSTLASGDVVTGYLGGTYKIADRLSLQGRLAYSRANTGFTPQASDQLDIQAMLRLEIDPLSPAMPRNWSIAPYGRFTTLSFDAANPLVNPFVARRDEIWIGGVVLDAPVTEVFGITGNFEFARNNSNLPNFTAQNLSVSLGPTLKF